MIANATAPMTGSVSQPISTATPIATAPTTVSRKASRSDLIGVRIMRLTLRRSGHHVMREDYGSRGGFSRMAVAGRAVYVRAPMANDAVVNAANRQERRSRSCTPP